VGLEDSVRLRAEVHCYHCGRVAGGWEWISPIPGWGRFQPTGREQRLPARLSQLRCTHCGGPVFLDEIERVEPRMAIVVEQARRGRPRTRPDRLAG